MLTAAFFSWLDVFSSSSSGKKKEREKSFALRANRQLLKPFFLLHKRRNASKHDAAPLGIGKAGLESPKTSFRGPRMPTSFARCRCRRRRLNSRAKLILSSSRPLPPLLLQLTVVKPAAVGAYPRPAHIEAPIGQKLHHGDERPGTIRRIDGNDGRRGSGDVVDGNLRRGHAQRQGLVLEQRRRGQLRPGHGRRAVAGVAAVGLRRRRAAVVLAAAAVSVTAAAAAACVCLFGRRQDAIPGARAAPAAASGPRLGLRRSVRIERCQGPPAMVISAEVEHLEPGNCKSRSLQRKKKETSSGFKPCVFFNFFFFFFFFFSSSVRTGQVLSLSFFPPNWIVRWVRRSHQFWRGGGAGGRIIVGGERGWAAS